MRWALALAMLVACGDGNTVPSDAGIDARLEGFAEPDVVCPGSPSCASTGDGVLKVAAERDGLNS